MSKTTKETVVTKRPWGGRKPLDQSERKVLVSIWPKNGIVETLGGNEKAQEIALKALEKEYAKIILEKD